MTDFLTRRTMMVDTQVRPSDVTSFPIIDAMLSVPRESFVPRDKREMAYVGENIDLGGGRVVMEPRTLAKMLEALDIAADELALCVGAGFGYTPAVMSHLAEAVVAVEEDDTLAEEAQAHLSNTDHDTVVVAHGALRAGAPDLGPYDVILVDGGVEHLPDALVDQLKDGGRIVCLFMEGALGAVRIGYKMDGALTWRFSFNAGAPVLPGFERHRAFTF